MWRGRDCVSFPMAAMGLFSVSPWEGKCITGRKNKGWPRPRGRILRQPFAERKASFAGLNTQGTAAHTHTHTPNVFHAWFGGYLARKTTENPRLEFFQKPRLSSPPSSAISPYPLCPRTCQGESFPDNSCSPPPLLSRPTPHQPGLVSPPPHPTAMGKTVPERGPAQSGHQPSSRGRQKCAHGSVGPFTVLERLSPSLEGCGVLHSSPRTTWKPPLSPHRWHFLGTNSSAAQSAFFPPILTWQPPSSGPNGGEGGGGGWRLFAFTKKCLFSDRLPPSRHKR